MAWRADWMSAVFWKITAVYGHIEKNGVFVRRTACSKNGDYGQNGQKWTFVRKMSFAYGQIIKNGGFVRKSGLNFGWMFEQHHFKKGIFCAENQRNVLKSQSKTDCLRSTFHLIRARNGTFFPVFSWGQIKWTISWKTTRNF